MSMMMETCLCNMLKKPQNTALWISSHLHLLYRRPPPAFISSGLYGQHFNSSHMNGSFKLNGHNGQVWGVEGQTSLPLKDYAAVSACFGSFTANQIYEECSQ